MEMETITLIHKKLKNSNKTQRNSNKTQRNRKSGMTFEFIEGLRRILRSMEIIRPDRIDYAINQLLDILLFTYPYNPIRYFPRGIRLMLWERQSIIHGITSSGCLRKRYNIV